MVTKKLLQRMQGMESIPSLQRVLFLFTSKYNLYTTILTGVYLHCFVAEFFFEKWKVWSERGRGRVRKKTEEKN